jgi:hypothetical protein
MTKDTVVAFRAPEGFSPDPLTDLLRQGARDLIAQAVEAELTAFLMAHADQTDAAGRRRLEPASLSLKATGRRLGRQRRTSGGSSGRRRRAQASYRQRPDLI